MTLELWNTFATFGTFIVIAATAIAALVQLRHARSGNQISALTEMRDSFETPQFAAAAQFVSTQLASKLEDPEFRYQIVNRSARRLDTVDLITKIVTVGNFYDALGLLVKTGLVEGELALNIWANQASRSWDALAPVAALVRPAQTQAVWEHFEYFVVMS
ncbi:MAG TPA: hypothetical protein VFF60_11600, partial [Candidatus Binatus sp.]|nr:hypothetical protein [Candidatus Binatus sp.]